MYANRTGRALGAFAILVGAFLGNPFPAGSLQDSKPSGDETYRRLREANARVLASLAKDLERPESRPADPRSRAELLGRDPARIVAFVQKEIQFEPYPGLQRGPAGVMVSGAGNALDKSFLLMELLRASGFEARMVRGTLSREQSGRLVKGWLEALKARPAGRWKGPFGRGEVNRERTEASCRDAGVSVEEVLRMVRAEEHAEQAAWVEVKALAAREERFLSSHRDPRDLTAVPMAGPIVEGVRTHAWVQWRAKDQNAWTEADPCLPGGPGVPSEGEIDPAGAADRFTLSLSLERKTGGKRETVEILKRDVGAYEALTEPMRFLIQPTDLTLPRPGEPFTPEDFYKQMAGGREFIAVVRVGEQPPGMMVFDTTGQVSKPKMAAGKIGGTAGGTAAGVAGLFGGDKDKGEKSTLERLWVDLSMSRGGRPLWTQRRTILEEEARETWCPVLTWDLFLPSGEVSAEFVRFVRVSHRLRNQPVFDAVDEWARSKNADLTKLAKVQVANYPLGLLAFAIARQAFVEAVGSRQAWLYFDRPNVFISGRQARLHVKAREVCLCYVIDLVDNGALVLEAGEEFLVHRRATTALGAFDTVLEQSRIAGANVPESAMGALAFFERARIMGHPMRLIAAGDSAALQAAGVSRVDAEWIGKRGASVLVAAGMDRSHCGGTYAWWEYDPGTGRALGRLAGGRGGCEALPARRQELAEYMETISSLNNAFCAGKVLGMLLGGKNDAAKDQALDCLVGQFEGKMLEMGGVGLIRYVADLIEFKENLAGK